VTCEANVEEEKPSDNGRNREAVAQVLARNGSDWDDFRQRLAGACGIPVADSKKGLNDDRVIALQP
jgi:hypothetical protein